MYTNTFPIMLRKALHALLAVMFVGLAMYTSQTALYAVLLILACVFLLTLRFGAFDPIRRAELASFGELFYVLGIFGTAVLFLPGAPIAFTAGVLVLGFADTAAALIGRQWGKQTYTIFGERRSYLGSTTALVVSAVILASFGVPIWYALLGGWLLATIEALMPRGSDNLALPIVAAMLVSLLAV